MIIRKIEEIKLIDERVNRQQTYHLILGDRDEGRELTREEMISLHRIIGETLKPDSDLYFPAQTAHLHPGFAQRSIVVDEAEDCPDYIEPQETTSEEIEIRDFQGDPARIEESRKIVRAEDRDYKKYIEMLAAEVPAGRIIDQMRDDFEISRGSAQNYYYRFVKPYQPEDCAEAESSNRKIEEEKKAREKQLEAKIVRKDDQSNREKALHQEIAALPDFKAADDFLTHAIIYEIGTDKPAKTLKEIYLTTHPGVKW